MVRGIQCTVPQFVDSRTPLLTCTAVGIAWGLASSEATGCSKSDPIGVQPLRRRSVVLNDISARKDPRGDMGPGRCLEESTMSLPVRE